MLIEAESIPYEPAQLRGERLLVLAPHPDDEVIGCGGLVALHLREGRPVRILVATDGTLAGEREVREDETRRGVALLGEADVEFLRFPDRSLGGAAAAPIREALLHFRPDLILVPAPVEIHPDHLALSRVFCELVQRDEALFADLAVARVAFYEVSHPLRPNAIVDITEVADLKYAAIAEHASQLAVRDYVAYARGLNAYRAMTLPPDARSAEAYHVVDLPALRTTPFSELRRRVGSPAEIAVTRTTLPITVVIRTKDRPALLREAIDSVHATRYPCEIVVVNDGGRDVDTGGARLVRHEESRGRSEAANAGARAATNAFLAFLDDDDLFYAEHFDTITRAAQSPHAAWYTDAISAFLRPGESGAYETHARLRLFAQDYDRELLRVDNYIPLPTLLIPRETFLDLGGFDPAFDLFEDWDFLIRLSERGDLLRIPRVTCEVRHFEKGSSVLLASPEGSDRFRAAKLQVWRKHAALLGHELFANVLERQKARTGSLYSQLVEARGQVDDLRRNMARLEREKSEVIGTTARMTDTINGYALRVRELEGAMTALSHIAGDYEDKVVRLERAERENDRLRATNHENHLELERLRAEMARLHVEVARLNGLLEMIYRSRTWKLHTWVERMKGPASPQR